MITRANQETPGSAVSTGLKKREKNLIIKSKKMQKGNQTGDCEQRSRLPLTIVIEGKEFEWEQQYITGEELRQLANLPKDVELYLSIADPWDDEAVGVKDSVDLAREGIESFYLRNALTFTVDEKKYEWKKQFITGNELRKLASVPANDDIYLLLQYPYEDELVENNKHIDLARPGMEHFRVRKKGEGVEVTICINDKPYPIKRGVHSVVELKNLGKVKATDELLQMIDGKLVPLADNAKVIIKGCEFFFSCKREGSSS